jgi:hypothetical protein
MVFCVCAIIGLTVYFRAKCRVNFFSGLLAFCNNLQTEIGFTLTPIAQVIELYSAAYPKEFLRMLSAYKKMLDSKIDITRERCLEIADIPQVADFFYELGRHGAKEEQSKIAGAIGIFGEMKKSADEYLKTKATLTLKLLLLLGVAGVILLL